ncbi:MAG: nucleotidyltransferase [Chloroflexi bacterium CG07_land_8_20_14_0_80_45_17]|nr:MAG: nucleotidyltransferase [Chloroflexi bacterium CG07_land_8_20_14_0_80_45_17]
MKTVDEIKSILAQHKEELRDRYKVKEIGIFGSYIRGEQREKSDLDILVEFEKPIGLEFIELAEFLESILEVKVDLVSKGAVKSNRWKYIEEDLIYV